MAIRFPGSSPRPPSIEGGGRFWFDNGPPLRRKADLLAERIEAGEAAINKIPRFRLSWCPKEEQQLRAQLPELAARMSDDELVSYVEDVLMTASEKNRKAHHGRR